jgi:hypothetical protein
MPESEKPSGWGEDALSLSFDRARANQMRAFAQFSGEFDQLVGIDRLFERLIEALDNSDPVVGVLIIRTHSAFRCAAELATSTQVPESYACLRLALENALYAFYLSSNMESQEVWLRRHDDDASLKAVRREFQIGALCAALATADRDEEAIFRRLYDRAIDYGAHPNERAVNQSLEIEEADGTRKFKSPYFTGDTPAFRVVLRTTAQVGACCLSVFRLIYRERFEILGLSQSLRAAKSGL